MDMGVGSFVFSQGIVSAIPLIKNPKYLRVSLVREVASVLGKCAPVLALGIVRVILVKGTQYPVSCPCTSLKLDVLLIRDQGTCH
jgi:glucosaminylphosphatidylinositol acyltransferase